jgi:hypothetical protein
MKAELLADATYKITLDKTEADAVPSEGKPCEMSSFICSLIDRLGSEQGVFLPEGRLLVEAFMRSDGSCVLFLSSLESEKCTPQPRLFACEISGVDTLRALCTALSDIGESCCIYCGSRQDQYRMIFSNPCSHTERVCAEFGEYCEISALFAAQTREYLTEISTGSTAVLSEMLS